MLLNGKVVVIHGAGGSVGTAVARAFAKAGAHVVLSGRSEASLGRTLDAVRATGGLGESVIADAMDEDQVTAALASVRERHGRVDVSFNLVGLEDIHGLSMLELPYADFARPIERAVRSHHLTATAAARVMDDGGALLALIANCGRQPVGGVGGFGVACAAIEALWRQLAVELGPRGIRTVCLLSAGSPDSAGLREVLEIHAANKGITLADYERIAGEKSMLKRLPSLAEVADAAVLFASDGARAMTGAVANVTCGEIAD